MTATHEPSAARHVPEPGGPPLPVSPVPGNLLWDYTRTLVKHRWWALAGFAALLVPVAVMTLTAIPIYRATARVLLADDHATIAGVSAGAGGAGGATPALDPQTQRDVVQNRALVRETVEALRLWEAPEFRVEPPSATTDEERARQLVEAFLGRLSIEVVPGSQVMAVSFEAADPALAARAANELAARYIERDRESRLKAATENADWLIKRLAEQRQQVRASETALQNYRESRDALSLEDRQNIVVQRLADLNAAVTKARTDRIARETVYQQLADVQNDPAALETHSLIASNGFIQILKGQAADLARREAELADQFGPKHPEMLEVRRAAEAVQAKLRAEVAKIVDGARSEYLAAQTQEESLTAALDKQKAEAMDLDRKGVEYAALEREAAAARQIFDTLLQQSKEAVMSSELQRSGARVIDAAEPPAAPIRPQRNRGLIAALVLGVFGGLGAVFVREYLRTRIATPRDVEEHLGLPVLALIPAVSRIDAETVGALPPLPAEAFRRLRTSILLSGNGAGGQVLVVTSTAPQEGKTLVAANLAATLAAADQKVALIDADMRRPRLHRLFDRPREPGLADVLTGRRATRDALRTVPHPGLSLMPSGAAAANPSELLSLAVFKDLVESLRREFDWIVIDSSPVMAVTDAAVLAHDASAVLFVTTAEQTRLEAAETALAELNAVGARLIGAVLNRAPIQREAYYYGRYYRPEYASYCSPETPEPQAGRSETKPGAAARGRAAAGKSAGRPR